MKAVVAAFNQEKALVGAFSVITNLRMELFQALVETPGQLYKASSGSGSLLSTGLVPAVRMVVVGPLLALLLLSSHALAAPIFFSTGNPGVDGAIAGAGLGLVAGETQSV